MAGQVKKCEAEWGKCRRGKRHEFATSVEKKKKKVEGRIFRFGGKEREEKPPPPFSKKNGGVQKYELTNTPPKKKKKKKTPPPPFQKKMRAEKIINLPKSLKKKKKKKKPKKPKKIEYNHGLANRGASILPGGQACVRATTYLSIHLSI